MTNAKQITAAKKRHPSITSADIYKMDMELRDISRDVYKDFIKMFSDYGGTANQRKGGAYRGRKGSK